MIKTGTLTVTFVLIWALSLSLSLASEPQPVKRARKPVKLPGMVVDFEKTAIDLEATICLDKGLLELVACSTGSKEHESIVAVSAKAMHIHTGLLLLGANNGHPAMRKQLGDEKRWVNVPPRGDPIDVFLVTESSDGKPIERPISDFVVHSTQRVDEVDGSVINAPKQTEKRAEEKRARLTNGFVFAGSRLEDSVSGTRKYVADSTGNVISIATFGDELLCLPFRETQKNDALMWQVKPRSLPKRGTKVILRLRPRLDKAKPSPTSASNK